MTSLDKLENFFSTNLDQFVDKIDKKYIYILLSCEYILEKGSYSILMTALFVLSVNFLTRAQLHAIFWKLYFQN